MAGTLALVLVGAVRGGETDRRGDAPPAVAAGTFATDTVAVFGPQAFDNPAGGTAYHVEQFTISPVPGARYTLRLENGSTPADSATVVLNGDTAITAADFPLPAGGMVSRVVNGAETNTLEVVVTGAAGSAVMVDIIAEPDPSFVVFGPLRDDVVQSGPNVVEDTFSIDATAVPPYTVYVKNGNADGTDRVRSGTVTLNGVDVVTPDDLSDNVGEVVRNVTLLHPADNTVRVSVNGNTGAFVEVHFTATDTTPPVLEVATPAAGTVVSTMDVEVNGTVQDQTAMRVVVNGVVALRTPEGGFSATVPLAAEGDNTVATEVTDAAGKQTVDVRTVIRDTQAPVLTVTSPADGTVTNAHTVVVTGTVSDGTSVAVNVNALPAVVDSAGGFAATIGLAEGANVLATTAADAAGNATSDARTVTRDTAPPTVTIVEPAGPTETVDDSVRIAGHVTDATPTTVTLHSTPTGATRPATVSPDGSFQGWVPVASGANEVWASAADAAGNAGTSETRSVQRLILPPDPADVAPPLDPTVATSFAAATEFLYTGADPVQREADPAVFEQVRVAVVRGRVVTRDGDPLPGATVAVHGHPEYGYTLSREDGWYDLAVNGGGRVTLNISRAGYLPAQRPVEMPWRDYVFAQDVALVMLDSVVTAIDLTDSTQVQVARGSVQTDVDGTRRATLMFEPGTAAVMVLPDGTEQPLSTLHVRATEYTVGEGGPAAMPANLPPQVGYTYAVELSVDEAMAAGATSVEFSQPVAFYVENFLGFPVGENVPVGVYDFDRATWVPEDNGRVVEIVGVSAGGLAELDVDGSGAPADAATLSALGISDGERARVAGLYTVGTSLWRITTSHFSLIDLNWVLGAIAGAIPPGMRPGAPNGPPPCEGKSGGSIIGCESQSLGEAVGIVGTPFRLHYSSLRTPGNRAAYTLDIPLTDSILPDSLREVRLEIWMSGRTSRLGRLRTAGSGGFSTMTEGSLDIVRLDPDYAAVFAPEPNLRHQFTWDGEDTWGRKLQGRKPVNVRIGYTYPGAYYQASAVPQAFGAASGFPISTVSSRREATIWQEYTVQIGPFDARGLGMGGWSLDVHHSFDPQSQVLYLGDGTRVAADDLPSIIDKVAGYGFSSGSNAEGIPALEARLNGIEGVVVGPDGSIYVGLDYKVRRIDPNGIITTVAGSGACCSGPNGDGGPATQARLNHSLPGLAIGPDGSLYIADFHDNRVRRVGPDGIITTVAGTGAVGYSGDGALATQATFNRVHDVAVGPDGSIYIADAFNRRVRRVSPSGIVTTVAGNGSYGTSGDGGPATEASMLRPTSVTVASDGTLYIGDLEANRVRRVAPDGIISTFAGTGGPDYTGDGRSASQTGIQPHDVTLDREGNLYVALNAQYRILRVDADGIVRTVAGSGRVPCTTPIWWECTHGPDGDGGPATAAMLYTNQMIAVGPDGALYIADQFVDRVRKVGSGLPGVGLSEYAIPSADGSELYHFDARGRHLRTLDALTGAELYRFDYDTAGRLASVTDADGRITTIERDPEGRPVAIVASFGQRTELAVDSAGWLARIENPAGDTVAFDYTAEGLLEHMATPRGHLYAFAYDSLGRLIRDDDPAGGFKELARTDSADAYTVTLTTALGRATRYSVEPLDGGTTRRRTTDPAGLTTTRMIGTNGRSTITAPDGTTTTVVQGADPRLGMQAPITKSLTVRLPSGSTSTVTTTRRVELADVADPLSLIRQTDTVRVNGRAFASSYEAAMRRMTSVTPEGRASVALLDSLGARCATAWPGCWRPRTSTIRMVSSSKPRGVTARRRSATTLSASSRR